MRPDLLLPHLREVLLEPFLHPFACPRHELTSSHTIRFVPQVRLSHSYSGNVHLMLQEHTGVSAPEIIDTVFTKASPNRSFSMTEYERFGLVFTKTRVYKFGQHSDELFLVGGHGTVPLQPLLLMSTFLFFINTSADPLQKLLLKTSF